MNEYSGTFFGFPNAALSSANRHLLLPFVIFLFTVLTSSSAMANSRVIETSVRTGELVKASDGEDHAFVGLELHSKIWTLIGEPVSLCVAKWSLGSVSIDGKHYTHRDLPAEVRKQITLYDARINLRLYSKAFGYFYYYCDPGVFSAAGNSKASFNVPGSPDWSKMFYRLPDLTTTENRYFSSLDAKAAFKDPLTTSAENYLLGNQQIEKLSVNLSAVRQWLAEQYQQKLVKQQQQAEQRYAKAKDNLDDFFAVIDDEKALNKNAQAVQQKMANIQSRQSTYQQDQQQKYERLTQQHCNSEISQLLADTESLEQAADINLRAYNQCYRDSTQWGVYYDDGSRLHGYKNPTGQIVIPARFKYAKPFSQGLAGFKDNSDAVNSWGFINSLGNVAITPQFERVSDFKDGKASVRKFRRRKNHGRSACDGWTDYYDKGEIDKTGRWIAPPKTETKRGGELCLQRE